MPLVHCGSRSHTNEERTSMFQLPVIQGLIDRRILVNFRVDPDVFAKRLPAPFRPQLYGGVGIAGICLIRLKHIRPRGWPAALGLSSENAAHRIAVEWEQDGETRTGVYIPRRDTSSRLNSLAGGRIFPGVHHLADFDVVERDDHYSVTMQSDDGTRISVAGRVGTRWEHSTFPTVDAASAFFKAGAIGYSASPLAGAFDGLELRTFGWKVEPLSVEHVESSLFGDRSLFPPGSVEFDDALLMRSIEHEWHARGAIRLQCGRVGLARHS